MFAEAERHAGPIDVLICNAGLSVPGAWAGVCVGVDAVLCVLVVCHAAAPVLLSVLPTPLLFSGLLADLAG